MRKENIVEALLGEAAPDAYDKIFEIQDDLKSALSDVGTLVDRIEDNADTADHAGLVSLLGRLEQKAREVSNEAAGVLSKSRKYLG